MGGCIKRLSLDFETSRLKPMGRRNRALVVGASVLRSRAGVDHKGAVPAGFLEMLTVD